MNKIILILKKINTKNISRGIDIFAKVIQDFGTSMDQLTKELASPKKDSSKKNKEDLEKIWGRDSHSLGFKVKIWSNYPKNQLESQRSKDEINLEKLWGKRK